MFLLGPTASTGTVSSTGIQIAIEAWSTRFVAQSKASRRILCSCRGLNRRTGTRSIFTIIAVPIEGHWQGIMNEGMKVTLPLPNSSELIFIERAIQ